VRTFKASMSSEGLAEKIWQAWTKHEDYEEFIEDDEDRVASMSSAVEKLREFDCFIPLHALTTQIIADLERVRFCAENIECFKCYPFHCGEPLLGLHTLSSGLTFLGIMAGGDWERPIFFIIYYDDELRAYVPEDGNVWNTDTNEAYGNDNKKDAEDVEKRFPDAIVRNVANSHFEIGFDTILYDFDKMKQQIEREIVSGM